MKLVAEPRFLRREQRPVNPYVNADDVLGPAEPPSAEQSQPASHDGDGAADDLTQGVAPGALTSEPVEAAATTPAATTPAAVAPAAVDRADGASDPDQIAPAAGPTLPEGGALHDGGALSAESARSPDAALPAVGEALSLPARTGEGPTDGSTSEPDGEPAGEADGGPRRRRRRGGRGRSGSPRHPGASG